MTIPKAAHTVYKLLMMGGKTAQNMESADNNKESCISCISLVIQNTRSGVTYAIHSELYTKICNLIKYNRPQK